MKKTARILGIAAATVILASSCSHERSSVTGWNYNDPKNGGFEVMPYEEQETGPGLVFIEGGTFTMGRAEDDVMYDWNSVPRRVTVSSFYIDETEVTNTNYREYLYWTARVFGPNYPQVYIKALPDTLVWRNKLAYNEPYVKYYLRHPAYNDYPVVGVDWLQATDFCKWRTDRVNEFILVREGIIDFNPTPSDADYFNTDEYLSGKWTGQVKTPLPDLNPSGSGERNVRMEDGIFLPDYRLPTEAEWEFAAAGLIGNTTNELVFQRRIYPWNGHATRNPDEKYIGQELGDFVKGAGDYMGVAGDLNDAADITAPVYSYWPNDYGLYGMAGNVSEWVMDVYRPLTPQDENEFRAYRGNQFETQVKDQDGIVIQDSVRYNQDSDITSIPGQVKYRYVDKDHKEDNLANRRNYHESDERSYVDGDLNSSIYYGNAPPAPNKIMYETGTTTLISDQTHVYKGGSWKDRAFWMSPGTRRFLEEHQATDYIGFRCAMTRVGSPVSLGNSKEAGKY
ncbi:MAG TPA: SUMF1/EgtB/PvdO family nonheme iron enzyme [Bacteroidia bacterium]|nr:SUMF1/EgtB/PvdO family nonheme iron enzyme [Bacteroidia bacterium]